MDKTVFISVVRDYGMYRKCVSENPHTREARCVDFDNRERNEAIPVCYNRFLDGYDFSDPAWFVFCHEDFQPLEPLSDHLERADLNTLYGPIGVVTRHRWRVYCHGEIEACSRQGGNPKRIGHKAPMGTPVETFDCQCLIVHSSCVARHKLRFDENLTFDLYVEDFCIAAKEKHGIESKILPVRCRHWSDSTAPQMRYFPQKAYLREKYPDACYTGTCLYAIGGGAPFLLRMNILMKRIVLAILRKFRLF